MSQLDQNYPGADIKILLKLKLSTGTYINIDDLAELYVYILRASGTIVKQYSKAGTGDFTALIKDTTTQYHFWITSEVSKLLETEILDIEINMVETNAELPNGQNTIGKAQLVKLVDNTIKVLS